MAFSFSGLPLHQLVELYRCCVYLVKDYINVGIGFIHLAVGTNGSIWCLVPTLPLGLVNYGCGQALEQFAIASPTFLGHVVYPSKQLLASLIKPKQDSKGWRKIQRPLANMATGHATKKRRINQRREKHGLLAIVKVAVAGWMDC
jgi:hypothetical protein